MSEMVTFHYTEFYDVPRAIVLRYRNKLILLQSAFDDELDDYPDSYSVYELPDSVEELATCGSWTFMEHEGLKLLGQVSIQSVRFDSTKRQTMDACVLENLITK